MGAFSIYEVAMNLQEFHGPKLLHDLSTRTFKKNLPEIQKKKKRPFQDVFFIEENFLGVKVRCGR